MIKLQDKFWFGKHRGEVIEDYVYDEPSYIKWCLDNVNDFNFNDDDYNLVMNAYYELSDDLDEYDGSYELRFER